MLEHWIWLTTRKYVGTRGCAALIEKYGSAEKVYAMSREDFLADGIRSERALGTLTEKSLEEAKDILYHCELKGIKILTYGDPIYPTRLKNIPDPPLVLYYRGTFPDVDNEAGIGIVGTRSSSLHGLLNAKEFSKSIACGGGMVITGGARGVDTMALKGALEGQTPVICVLGCGVDISYPRENEALFFDVTKHGCVISEYKPGTQAFASNFPARNRIISGLSLGVLVVEAPQRSGALITANHALEQGRDVFAIPGPIRTNEYSGNNQLLREGAYLAQNGWDVLSEYQNLFPDKLFDPKKAENMKILLANRYAKSLPIYSPVLENPTFEKKIDIPEEKKYIDEKPAVEELHTEEEPVVTASTPDEKLVLGVLKAEPISVDRIAAGTGLPMHRIASALVGLQIKKLAVRMPGNLVKRN